MKKDYIRWAIAGESGLYVDQRLSRVEAIANHVRDLYGVPHTHGRGLDTDQLKAWERCKRNGDRAVKVRMTII